MMLLYRRRWGLCYLPVLAACALAIWAAATYVLPLPPRTLPLAVGTPQGGYAQAGERYRAELERQGINVELVTTESVGALGPLQRLATREDPSQAGFAHGLLADRGPEAKVLALAVVGRQALWVFTRDAAVTQVQMLRGLKVAAGPAGSPTRAIAERLLAQAQVPAKEVDWQPLQGMRAANELLEQHIDAYVTIGSGDAPTVRLLSRSPGISMLGVERVNAIAAVEPRLRPFVLPQGAIELRGNIPPRDLTLLTTGTHLLVRDHVHPALQRALLDAASDIHALPNFIQQQAEYPEFQTDFPLSPVARRFANGDRPWMETVLPYWWAQLAELLLYAVFPIVVLTVLILLLVPRLFSLRVDAMLSHYYGELKFLENDVDQASEKPIAVRALVQKLDQMELDVAGLDLPDRYADRWYTLREHLRAARSRLMNLRGR
ncbi:TAXI family TRAP transporter solute-binding subunit [Ramlibacter albus]|uniref:ABC transporter substrate-binding protein n=1 Tax=Ramlibacter albus TaxID=2079448 RepID=A0A923S6T8_9BURK|nr:ABC transporter substrate-binding protein [Ramlibacter albus]MBC5766492.1 ABC transporter substrate-binding protein [Ramlibacter albus]